MSPACRTLTLCLLSLAAGAAPAQEIRSNPFAGWYAGMGLSYANLRIPGRSVELSGIQFNDVKAKADRAGFKLYLGYWIDPHLAFEFGAATFGHADATFSYQVPPAESGTGATTVEVSNASLSLLAAQPVGRCTLFLRGGVQAWHLGYKTSFRLATGENQYRELTQKGNGILWGGGAEYALRGAWRLRLEGEVQKMDITDARSATLGLTYRF
jgi:opacity protein-like surface antigen